MARIVVAGAGAVGASVAYHLAALGARDVVLADRGEIARGQTARALGGVRQQFSTAAEVRLAQESIGFFQELGPPLFLQVGYLFLATTEAANATLVERATLQQRLGVRVELVDAARAASRAPGVVVDDVVGGTFGAQDGVADAAAVTLELVRRAAELGVDVRERIDARRLGADVRVLACGPWSREVARSYGVELPVRPLCRQLLETAPVPGLADRLPLVIESETGFHFRRRGDRLVLAMRDEPPRWDAEPSVDEEVFSDRLARLGRRFPAGRGVHVERAWAGLYDMTADAHPIVGPVGAGIYAACGFSGHGFMQSPAVGRALAEEILEGASSVDLAPYRLERFAGELEVPETLVL